MLQIIALATLVLGVCFLGMGVKVFFHHSHRFPETSAGHNAALRKRGIRCPREEEAHIHGYSACGTCKSRVRVE